MIEELLPQAILCGVSLKEFWDFTLADINVYVEAYKIKTKQELSQLYMLAHLTGIAVASYNPICEGKVKYPSLHKLFPDLFEEIKPEAQDWQEIKARLLDFASKCNKERGL